MAKRKAAAPKAPKAPKVVDPTARLIGRAIPGDGPTPCRLMLVGEAGGKDEARTGRPFTGSAGQMFWSTNPAQFPGILDALHLPRASIFVTNVIKQSILGDKDPTPQEIAHFRPAMLRELELVKPEIIIAAGAFASRWFLGPDTNMDLVHGLPHWSDEFQLPVVPCFHPAAGLHETDMMAAVYWDYAQAAAFIRDEIGLHVVESTPTTIRPLPDQLRSYPYLGADTESLIDGSTWCLTASWADGQAAFIPADDRATIARFAAWTQDRAGTLFMHHALHDIRAMRQFDIDLARALIWDATDDRGRPIHSARLIDTMVLAFERGKIDAQGLKALAYRRLNRKMRAYEDVVGPYQQRMAYDYLVQLLGEAYAGAFPEPVETASVVDGKVKISKPWSLARRLERLLADYDADPAETDLVKRWSSIDDPVREPAERLCGMLPKADLSHVPLEEATLYACDDAASTRALGLLFWPQHRDRDLIRIATVDHGAMPLIGRMVDNGLPAQRQYFLDLGTEMRALQAEMVDILETVVGYPVNPNSSDQVADLVFNVLGLEAVKTTPGGKPSTGKKALQHLRAHPYVEWILQSREFGKLDNAFCANIAARVVDLPDGGERVYADLLHTRVKTGRLASKNPNVLAIPARSALGMRVRAGFIAPPGRILGAWDMSQVEMRTLADRSGDPDLIRAYIEHRDLHTETAAAVFGVKIADVTKTQRTVSKCFHPDTEVLTKTGWKRILDLAAGEEIIQAFPSDGGGVRLSWCIPTDVHSEIHPSGQLVHLRNTTGMNLRVTPDHRMLGWLQSGRWFVCKPEQLDGRARTWANAGVLSDHDKPKYSIPLLRLAVALQADGSITKQRHVIWGFTKERKIARLRFLLTVAAVPYRQSSHTNGKNPDVTHFDVHTRDSDHLRAQLDSDKTLPWRWLGLPLDARQAIVEEARFWDAHSHARDRSYQYSSTIEKNVDVLQALAVSCGRKALKREQPKPENPNHATVFYLSVKDHYETRSGTLKATTQVYTDHVACLSTPSSFVLVRDRGITTICGQSISFGVIMGITGRGLVDQIRLYGLDPADWPADRCDEYIEQWLDVYRGVRDYQFRRRAEARRYGYVEDLFGRRYDLPHARCPLSWIREEALRQSHALDVQGSAQGLMKRAMRAIETELLPACRVIGLDVRPVLFVHDEFVLEMPEGAEELVHPMMEHCLTQTTRLASGVPLETGHGFGQSWADLK